MNLRIYLSLALLSAVSFLAAACGGAETPANNAASNAVNANAANTTRSNANSPVAVTTPTPGDVRNNAPTLTPVYKAYCAAMVKKNDAEIRKYWTADSIQFFESEMKAEGIRTLSEYLDPVSTDLCEVADEQIKGDKAVAKVKTKSYPNGFDVLFVKENGEWKMSNIDPKKEFN